MFSTHVFNFKSALLDGEYGKMVRNEKGKSFCSSYDATMGHLDFLKALRFSFPVPVVGPKALALSLALRACEKNWVRLVGKSMGHLESFSFAYRAPTFCPRLADPNTMQNACHIHVQTE